MTYNDIISHENLLEAWKEFLRGKHGNRDVQEFQYRLADNIFALHVDLQHKAYKHGGYYAFNISDPKPRNIHKATVRDRLLHHAIHRVMYPIFDTKFIHDSYSCREYKGTHRAMERFRNFAYQESSGYRKTVWVLKCDIRKFFATIDHEILMHILAKHITDEDALRLVRNIIESFHAQPGKGLPLGNLTSQLLVNLYMNEFDQHVKHKLRVKYYIRYADDFVILSRDRLWLEKLILEIEKFLLMNLKLHLHPHKVYIKTYVSGVDFLGWVHFPKHRVLRTTTKKRVLKAIKKGSKRESLQAYEGLLEHGNAYKLTQKIRRSFRVSS